MEPSDPSVPEPGTIAQTVAMLARWGRLAPQGLARVEFVSEHARQRVVEALRAQYLEDGIPFAEVALPTGSDAAQIVRELKTKFQALPPGVVSLSGFEIAFPDGPERVEALGALNFNRENLALHPLRQIWWMTPLFAQTFLQIAPDLDSWFILRLQLNEVVHPLGEVTLNLPFDQVPKISVEEARQRSAELVGRFERALGSNAPLGELLELVLPAVEAWLDAGWLFDAMDLQEKLFARMAEHRRAISSLALDDGHSRSEAIARSGLLVRLAQLYRREGDQAAAEPLLLRALAIREEALGPGHVDVATVLSALARLRIDQRRFVEAEPLLRRALAIQERALGNEHPSYGATLHVLAGVLSEQGKLTEAERLLQEVLAIQGRALGSEHPEYLGSLHELAVVLALQGQYAEAERSLREVLSVVERTLGKEHPFYAISLQGLAIVLAGQGNAEAVEVARRALDAFDAALDAEHPTAREARPILEEIVRHGTPAP